MVGRFINADEQINEGVLGANLFAYCENNPVNMVDSEGTKPGDLFSSIDAAAQDFARTYNKASINAKQEYGSAIYSFLLKVKIIGRYYNSRKKRYVSYSYTIVITKYSYTKPNIGKKGNSVTPNFVTRHKIVSTIHTHANYDSRYDNEIFSTGWMTDIGWSNLFRMNSYLVTPGGALKKYTFANRKNSNGGITILLTSGIYRDPNSPVHY